MLIVARHLRVHESDRDRYVTGRAEAVNAASRADGWLDFAVSADAVDGRDDDTRDWVLAFDIAQYEIP